MRRGHDLSRLVRFLGRAEWAARMDEVLGDHVRVAVETFDLDWDECSAVLGEHWAVTLWGCALEDLLTRRFEPDGANLADDYVKRRGWNETAPAKMYLRALQGSVPSLYEVSDIVPGVSLRARDLLRGGEPVQVSEASATRSLDNWDRLAARVLTLGGKRVLAGGVLPYSVEASEALDDAIRRTTGQRKRSKLVLDEDALRRLTPLFSTTWLADVLPKALGEAVPELRNGDGDALLFHRVRLPLKKGTAAASVAGRLKGLAGLRQDGDGFWNWVADPRDAGPVGAGKAGVALSTTLEDGATVLGTLELDDRALVLMANSAARAERGMALLRPVLGELVGAPLTEIQTLDQLRAAGTQTAPAAPDIPPEQLREIVHGLMDKQYQATLDQPVGMLDGLTPRQAVRRKAGRQKVAAWLKYLENQTAKVPDPADPMASYDFGWMWRELGVADLRS
jgi:hypothetical protein